MTNNRAIHRRERPRFAQRDDKRSGERDRPGRPPLGPASLRDLALAYVARFATSSGRLEAYLRRKLHERGWDGETDPDLVALVREFAERGYLDDAAYARARSEGLLRRGYGGRRVEEALRQAGIAEDLRTSLEPRAGAARQAALRLLQKRRFGPFAATPPDPARREKQLAAMLRAGHTLDIARNLVDAPTQEAAEIWAAELDEDNHDRDQDDRFA